MKKSRVEHVSIVDFEYTKSFRIKKSDDKDIELIMKKDDEERYSDFSHFVRCALRKQIRIEKDRIKLK